MRRLTLLATLPLVFGSPVHAGSVTTETTGFAYQTGGGVIAFGACDAHADAGAVATRVTCEVNGVSTTRAFPGPAAAAEVLTATYRPVWLCVSALAVFADGSIATSPRTCDRLAP